MSQPATLLHGIRVLDLTNVLAGPFASYQLALMGADVVKVEIPGEGDLARRLGADPALSAAGLGASFLAQNAGKRSLTLDLKQPRGKQVLTRLVQTADILLENFRPGVLARLGFTWPQLHETNPRLVYCAISGFGQSGPMRAKPAYDQIIQGLSGLMAVTGTPETAPLRVGVPICDTLGGWAAAFAMAAALVSREHTGQGTYLDVSMLETAVAAMGWVVSDYLIADHLPRPRGNENPTAAPSGTFATADGALNIAANKQDQFETVCRLVQREDLITDPRFALPEDRKLHREALHAELQPALVGRSSGEWEELLSRAGVPAGRVLSVPQALGLEQLADRQFVHQVPFPGTEQSDRRLRLVGNGVQVDARPLGPTTAPPLLGEHTAAILREAGFTEDEIRSLRSDGIV